MIMLSCFVHLNIEKDPTYHIYHVVCFWTKLKIVVNYRLHKCIGRVLRKDKNKLKKNGHIIDGCTIDDDNNKMKDIINKLIKYYLNLYEIAKSDFEHFVNPTHEISKNKLTLYNSIMRSLRLAPDEKKIYIDLKNNKKITLDLENVDLKSIEWNKLIRNLTKF